MKTLHKILDFIFGQPDEIIYKQLLADKLQEIAEKNKR